MQELALPEVQVPSDRHLDVLKSDPADLSGGACWGHVAVIATFL